MPLSQGGHHPKTDRQGYKGWLYFLTGNKYKEPHQLQSHTVDQQRHLTLLLHSSTSSAVQSYFLTQELIPRALPNKWLEHQTFFQCFSEDPICDMYAWVKEWAKDNLLKGT